MILLIQFLFSGIFKLVPGLAQGWLNHKKSQAIQQTSRQEIWSDALVTAAHADVEHRKVAAQERANSPWLMRLYINIVFWPSLYYTVWWMDTIFAGQVWTIFGWTIFDWGEFVLPAAPARLEEMGQWIIGIFIGGNTAVVGVVKGAKALRAIGMFKGQ